MGTEQTEKPSLSLISHLFENLKVKEKLHAMSWFWKQEKSTRKSAPYK